ncbi:MAG: hypothetical protein HYR94_12630, partial [Chloroflexi bacterium]|nr:hypothetical protein [Chloroflexota bacterium]
MQKRKEQKAKFGISADPSIDIEIEDIQTEIEQLQAKLQELKKVEVENIRTLLSQGFTDKQLRWLCSHVSDFRPVHDKLAHNIGKDAIIDQILAYAVQTGKTETLLKWVRKYNPTRYETSQNPPVQKRGTLSIKVSSKELTRVLNQAAILMRHYNLSVITAEVLLLAFLKMPEVEAHRLLQDFSQERGFAWEDFERDVGRTVKDQIWTRNANDVKDATLDFVSDSGER